ncbi:MAG: hypoxanthine phosphoribosyltransferase [Lachnospiraceae bacterium]|nr:hypoxanthine phosphoribosyltransferase [Lachnospiraceae bacterium]MEE3461775.1 hypoxanthine phosphoribosyltransferase [Lachnospiraceae bacterium]
MDSKLEVLISEEDVDRKFDELAGELTRDYEGKTVNVICILKGGVYCVCEITRRMKVPVTLDFMEASSYGSSTTHGDLIIKKDLSMGIEGKDCLIIEDIIDSGNTLYLLKKKLLERKPASLKICAFLNKPERREVDLPIEYKGFDIPDRFVVGCGMDYAEKYRNLPYIGVIQ